MALRAPFHSLTTGHAWRWWALALACLASAMANAQTPVLRVLAWPGYAEPEVVESFEKATGAKVQVTTVDSDEALWQKVNGSRGTGFDLFAVNTAELQRYIDAGLVTALNPARIPRIQSQQPRFRDPAQIAGLQRRDTQGNILTYGVPFTFSSMGLIYDKRQLGSPPTSLASLWNPAYKGKVLIYNGGTHNFSLAAQRLGIAPPFALPDDQWPAAVDALIALRRNALALYTQPDEATRLFMRHGAILMFANYGLQQVQQLRAAGADVGYAIVKEGALAWLDCWVITAGSRDIELAHQWINHLLGPQASELLVNRQGLQNTLLSTHETGDPLLWLEPVEDSARRENLWSRIRSGDRASRVLAP